MIRPLDIQLKRDKNSIPCPVCYGSGRTKIMKLANAAIGRHLKIDTEVTCEKCKGRGNL